MGYAFWAIVILMMIVLVGIGINELVIPEIVAPFNDIAKVLNER